MKKILVAAVALVIAFAPASLAQRPGPRPGAKPDTEKKDDKKDEPEKPAPELKVTASPSTRKTGTSIFRTASSAAGSWPSRVS